MQLLPVYQGLELGEERTIGVYVEKVVDLARQAWAEGQSDFVVAINAKTSQIVLVDRLKAVEIISEDMGTNKIADTLGSPAGPMAMWVLMMYKEGSENTVNIMKMTFMATNTKVGSA